VNFQKISKDLPNVGEEQLVGHLAALAEIVKAAPTTFEQKSDVIISFLVKEVLMQPATYGDVCIVSCRYTAT
jgi:sister chromatid cohesion protein PDS5